MRNKTKNFIIKCVVILLIIGLLIGILSPFIYASTTYKSYTNEDLNITMDITSDAEIEELATNAIKIDVNFNVTANLTYGDLYEEVELLYDKENDAKPADEKGPDLTREMVSLDYEILNDTWNSQEYIENYFKTTLSGTDAEYTTAIEKTTISGLPAWKCTYNSVNTDSSGYYYLTVANGNIYIIQLDCYLEDIANYQDIVDTMINSYEIGGIQNLLTAQNQVSSGEDSENTDGENTDTSDTASENTATQTEEGGISSEDIVMTLIIITVLGASVYYFLKERKYKKMKEERQQARKNRKHK